MSMIVERKLLIQGLRLMLRPLVRFCLRHTLRIQDLIECCKEVYIELASEQMRAQQSEVTASRLSIVSGLHRREVKRLMDNPLPYEGQQLSLTLRVIGLWRSDPAFVTKARKPRILSTGSEDSEFNLLVRKVSKDLNPATVLFELERVGAVERAATGLRLKAHSYVPAGDLQEGFKILAADENDLICAVEENVLSEAAIPNLHVRTEYDNVRPAALDDIRRWLIREGHLLHERARSFVAQHDQDINPDPEFSGRGAKVMLGSFSRVVSIAEKSDGSKK